MANGKQKDQKVFWKSKIFWAFMAGWLLGPPTLYLILWLGGGT